MNFDLNEQQASLRKELAEFCAAEIAPNAGAVDEKQVFPEDNWKQLAKQGVMGLLVPEKFGGKGFDLISGLVAVEEVSIACAATGMVLATSTLCCGKAVENFGTDALKEKYLPLLASGEIAGAFATTEANAGSDISAIMTEAKEDGDSYVINGGKSYVTNASHAGLIIVLAKTGEDALSLLAVPGDAEGVLVDSPIKSLGLRGAPASLVKFRDVKVPKNNLLGEAGKGLKIALECIDFTRLGVAAVASGISKAAFDEGKEHAETRKAFGKVIGKYQDVAFRITDMHVEWDIVRQTIFHAAWQKQEGMKCSTLIASVKLAAADTAVKNAGRAVAVLAGKGVLSGQVTERLYRDAKMTEFAGGTSDILRQVIAKDLLKD